MKCSSHAVSQLGPYCLCTSVLPYHSPRSKPVILLNLNKLIHHLLNVRHFKSNVIRLLINDQELLYCLELCFYYSDVLFLSEIKLYSE